MIALEMTKSTISLSSTRSLIYLPTQQSTEGLFSLLQRSLILIMNSDNGVVLMKGYVWATGADIGFRVGFKRYYFVLSDFLYYYETEESFTSGSTPVGGISLDAFCICKSVERGMFKLAIFAYETLLCE